MDFKNWKVFEILKRLFSFNKINSNLTFNFNFEVNKTLFRSNKFKTS